MSSISVLLSFKGLSQPELILFTDNVIYQTTSNPIFASLKLFIDPVADALTVFRAAYNAAKTGASVLSIERDKKHKELLDVEVVLAKEVEKFAKGDKAIIIASGFKASSDSQAITELLAPANFEVFNLKTKSVIQLNWATVEGKLNYIVEMRIVGEDNWKTIASPTAHTLTLSDLVRGSHLEFRVRASGTRNMVSPWSEVVDVHVD